MASCARPPFSHAVMASKHRTLSRRKLRCAKLSYDIVVIVMSSFLESLTKSSTVMSELSTKSMQSNLGSCWFRKTLALAMLKLTTSGRRSSPAWISRNHCPKDPKASQLAKDYEATPAPLLLMETSSCSAWCQRDPRAQAASAEL